MLKVRTLMEENAGKSEPIDPSFVENMDRLICKVTKDICRRILEEDKEETFGSACLLNRTIAFFLQDLLSCLNVPYVFRFIRTYIEEVRSNNE